MSKFRGLSSLLMNPFVLTVSMALGAAAGYLWRDFSLSLVSFGDAFMLIMKMCVYPVLVTALISSVGKLIRSNGGGVKGRFILLYYTAMFCVIGIITGVVVWALEPGSLSIEKKRLLGVILQGFNEGQIETAGVSGIRVALRMIIPENIFHSLSSGMSLHIMVFSVLLGIAAGRMGDSKGDLVIDAADAIFSACVKIMNWTMRLLPFGLFCILAGQVAQTGIELFYSLARFISSIAVASMILLILNTAIISIRARIRPQDALLRLKDPLFVSFGTRSTLASIPSAIAALRDLFGIDEKTVTLVVPIGFILARFSMMILYFSSVFFASQLYGLDLSFGQALYAFLLCAVISVAGAGTSAMVSLSMLVVVFAPLGLPYTAIVVLLLAVLPIVDPVITMVNVHANCAVVALMGIRSGRNG